LDIAAPPRSFFAMKTDEAVELQRVESVDVVRGLVMILMALDHVRDYLGMAGNPTDPATTTGALFFTRWITHFCAPTFFLLTGTGAFLSLRRKSKGELSRFLFTRGVWLIFLELVVVRAIGFQFNLDFRATMLYILWALGWAMISLSVLVWLPTRIVGAIGIVMILTHNLADSVQASSFGALAPVWTILHAPGVVFADSGHVVFAAYVLIPWIGVTAAGFALGGVFNWHPERRTKFLLVAGLSLTAAFVVLRASNLYGDPVRWTTQRSTFFTVLSFLNVNKYPPSLLFLLMTLGPALLFLRAVDGRTPALLRPALTYGKVPLFYYVLHLSLIHLIAVAVCLVEFGTAHWMFESPNLANIPFTRPPGWGMALPAIYFWWFIVVAALYPVCRWFAGVKRRRTDKWLSYL
jgi:uncharacterized membrane protein